MEEIIRDPCSSNFTDNLVTCMGLCFSLMYKKTIKYESASNFVTADVSYWFELS